MSKCVVLKLPGFLSLILHPSKLILKSYSKYVGISRSIKITYIYVFDEQIDHLPIELPSAGEGRKTTSF